MGCQKWLCLCAPIFLAYLWRSRWSEIVQRTVQLSAFLALADLFWHSNISNVKNAECHYRVSVHFGMCARKCMNNHGKQYVYFLYFFLSIIHLRRYLYHLMIDSCLKMYGWSSIICNENRFCFGTFLDNNLK